MLGDNVILLTDSYKVTHYRQYPPGTERVYSYLESRGGNVAEAVFFGLQYVLRRYLAGAVVSAAKIEEAGEFLGPHFGDRSLFNRAGWEHIVRAHGGRLPVRIRAVPEGTPVPVRNVLLTIENTDPACFWLTSYLETLLVQVWYPSTVATLSREMKRLILGYLERTGDPTSIETRLHDFGFRGSSSVETAGIGAAAHLLSFTGTDTLAGCIVARDHYGAGMAGFSIPAAEHSTMTAWGRENEAAAFENMLTQFPTGVVAVVSDSWDVLRACRELWGGVLRERVKARDGVLVIRPDSGEPASTVLAVLETLGERFGAPANSKGYRRLPANLAVIWGDGIDHASARLILEQITAHGWSADNLSFGMGGGLLQKVDRDTHGFALKCSEVVVNGVARDVSKEPVTDPGKASKAGRLALVRADGSYRTVRAGTEEPGADLLRDVFVDGEIVVHEQWTDVRARAGLGIASRGGGLDPGRGGGRGEARA